MRNSARILFLVTFSCFSLFGQAKGGGTPAGPGTAPTPTPSTTTPPPTNRNPVNNPNQNNFPTVSRPMYVSGRVVMDDGTAPPSSVTIVRTCNGISRAMGYTNSKGDFSFDLNHA
jgi:hypothetical protein